MFTAVPRFPIHLLRRPFLACALGTVLGRFEFAPTGTRRPLVSVADDVRYVLRAI